MRKPSVPSSKLLHPTDLILGSIGAVRILRQLALHGDIITTTNLARRTKLNRRGVSEILDKLATEGIIENVTSAGRSAYRLNSKHYLASKLIELYQAEAQRAPELYKAVAKLGSNFNLTAVWLFGSTARGSDTLESDVDLVFVSPAAAGLKKMDSLQESLSALGDKMHLSLSPTFMTVSEVKKLKSHNPRFRDALLKDALTIYGSSASEIING